MTYKQLLFRSAAREKIVRGATQLADAIRITLARRGGGGRRAVTSQRPPEG
jgi:hypothetical protein